MSDSGEFDATKERKFRVLDGAGNVIDTMTASTTLAVRDMARSRHNVSAMTIQEDQDGEWVTVGSTERG